MRVGKLSQSCVKWEELRAPPASGWPLQLETGGGGSRVARLYYDYNMGAMHPGRGTGFGCIRPLHFGGKAAAWRPASPRCRGWDPLQILRWGNLPRGGGFPRRATAVYASAGDGSPFLPILRLRGCASPGRVVRASMPSAPSSASAAFRLRAAALRGCAASELLQAAAILLRIQGFASSAGSWDCCRWRRPGLRDLRRDRMQAAAAGCCSSGAGGWDRLRGGASAR